MKKLFISASILAFGALALTSCSSSNDGDLTVIRVDNPTDEVKNKYNITFMDDVNNTSLATRLNTADLDQNSSYYAVYVAKDYASTAFVYTKDIDDDLEEKGSRIVQFNVGSVAFKNLIYSSEQNDIASAVFNQETGLAQFNGNGEFDFDIDSSANLIKSISATNAIKAYENGVRNIKLQMVYMPTYIVRHYQGKTGAMDILKTILFVPVYYCYMSGDKEITANGELIDSKITNIRTDIEFEWTDDGHVFDGQVIEQTEA